MIPPPTNPAYKALADHCLEIAQTTAKELVEQSGDGIAEGDWRGLKEGIVALGVLIDKAVLLKDDPVRGSMEVNIQDLYEQLHKQDTEAAVARTQSEWEAAQEGRWQDFLDRCEENWSTLKKQAEARPALRTDREALNTLLKARETKAITCKFDDPEDNGSVVYLVNQGFDPQVAKRAFSAACRIGEPMPTMFGEPLRFPS
jgi:hypothetical protein